MRIPFSVYDFFGYLAAGFVLLVAVDFGFSLGILLNVEISTTLAIFYSLLVYVAGHVIANLASSILEHGFLRRVLVSPEVTLFDSERRSGAWAKVFPGFYRPFPAEVRQRILSRAESDGIRQPGRGLFLHCHPIVIQSDRTAERLTSFLNLYGFCRNLSMAALLAVPILLAGAWLTERHEPAWWAVVAATVAIAMLYRYLKFFKHYTEEVFRAYAALGYASPPILGTDT
jgi:hypothetical protein